MKTSAKAVYSVFSSAQTKSSLLLTDSLGVATLYPSSPIHRTAQAASFANIYVLI